jgi:hypothetical protein
MTSRDSSLEAAFVKLMAMIQRPDSAALQNDEERNLTHIQSPSNHSNTVLVTEYSVTPIRYNYTSDLSLCFRKSAVSS